MKKEKIVERILYSTSVLLNVYICLSIILLAIYLIAPFLGGILSLRALLFYGSWIGVGFVAKYNIGKYQKKVPLKWYESLLQSVFALACMFLWFRYPINIISSLLIIVANIIGKKIQDKYWGKSVTGKL